LQEYLILLVSSFCGNPKEMLILLVIKKRRETMSANIRQGKLSFFLGGGDPQPNCRW